MNAINEEQSAVAPSGAGRATDAEGQLFVAAHARAVHLRSEPLGAVELGAGDQRTGGTSGAYDAGGSYRL